MNQSIMPERIYARIQWGAGLEPPGMLPKSEEYDFETKDERDAFLWGVSEACGWMDYKIVFPSRMEDW